MGGLAFVWYAKVYSLLVVPIVGDDCLGIVVWLGVAFCLGLALTLMLEAILPYIISIPLQLYRHSSVNTLDLNRERDMESEERDVIP